uniref:Uncharacterized protein n=1 Tax=Lepeophtheirus salmonis TaxID=72036 RepID=A0A0K2UUN9_LEPSM
MSELEHLHFWIKYVVVINKFLKRLGIHFLQKFIF